MNTYNKIPDEQLICRLRNGEDEIMDYLMIKYKSMVRRKARAMYLIGGDNDDCHFRRNETVSPSGL